MEQTALSTEQPRERRLQAVPDPKDGDDGCSPGKQALITALRQHPGGGETSSALADLAQIGRSTARRLLGELVEQGLVTRTPGSGGGPGRSPDRFSLANDLVEEATAPAGPGPLAVVPAPDVGETATAGGAGDDEAFEAGDGGAVDAETTVPTITPAPEPVAPVEVDRDTHGPVPAGSETRCAWIGVESAAGPGPGPRLGRNELRGKVEQYLIEHPEQDFSPHALSRLMGHSSGAVTNVLIKLVQAGHAQQTQTHPRRFAASTHQEN